jgi:dTDP-4-dehydrorhamnose reductase
VKKLLITGAGGFLGSHLVALAKSNFDVFGFSHQSKIDLPEAKCAYFSLADATELLENLNKFQPDYIIHCAAISSEAACKANEATAHQINVVATQMLKDYCLHHQKRMVFTSSDLVFDSEHAPYKVSASAYPKLVYGQLKRAAEINLLSCHHISIVRIPLLYGIGLGDRKGLLADFIDRCRNNANQSLFTDEFRNPVWVKDIAQFLTQLLLQPHSGILHLGGFERLSRFDLGQQFCESLDLSAAQILPTTRAAQNMSDRPFDTTMHSEAAYKLGFQPKKLTEALAEIKLSLGERTGDNCQ